MSAEYRFDETQLFNRVDEALVNLDMKVLMMAKLEMMKKHEDTSLIDKAIAEKERREKKQTKSNKSNRKSLLFALIDGLTSSDTSNKSDLMSWEEDAIKNDGYEPFNFEEEELEEDDYYFDDDK